MNFARALALFVSFALSVVAEAGIRNPAEGRGMLKTLAASARIPHYEKALPNGATRVFLNVSGPHVKPVEELLGAGSNVFQAMHIGYGTYNHTLVIFDGRLLDLEHFGTGWHLVSWGDGLRGSEHKLFSALIHLTDSEGSRLRGHLAAAEREQGHPAMDPDLVTPQMLAAGQIGQALGVPGLNCATGFTSMPVGDHGETLAQLAGVVSSGNPRGFQQELELRGNDRVFGVVVYGPQLPGFETHPEQLVTHW